LASTELQIVRNGALPSTEKWLVNFMINDSRSELLSVAADPMIKPGRPLKTPGNSLGCISSMVTDWCFSSIAYF
jgi:hypothetical protein